MKKNNIKKAKKKVSGDTYIEWVQDAFWDTTLESDWVNFRVQNQGDRHLIPFGWNYAWYRDSKGQVKEVFPESKSAPSYKFRTN